MDYAKIGKLVYTLRKEKNLTQLQLAEYLTISDKTVSKWERGLGCPDVSLLPALSNLFQVDMEQLLMGERNLNARQEGNMKHLKFYICPHCGNLITAMAELTISCCGKKLQAARVHKATKEEQLTVEIIENHYFITSKHEMTKEHYISFVALLSGDSLILHKQYPEWDLQTRIPVLAHGNLLWYCNTHGLLYQWI